VVSVQFGAERERRSGYSEYPKSSLAFPMTRRRAPSKSRRADPRGIHVRKAIYKALKRWRSTNKIRLALELLASYAVIVWSGMFDGDWYRKQIHRRVWLPRFVAIAHYVLRGRKQGRSPHPLFEPEYFDPKGWRKGAIDPFARYLIHRRRWKQAPHPLFHGGIYLESTPEAWKHRFGPLGHFAKNARPDTSLPVVPVGGRTATVTWGEARERLEGRLAEWMAQEKLRRTTRITPSYDRRRERRFLRTWRSAPLPRAEPDAPLVSVIIPVWNRSEDLREAIASVQAQTLSEWELLVVDDGSVDQSAAVVEEIAAGDPRVKLFRQPHSGVCRARNLALEHARSRYVAFLDSDNTYVPHFLRTAVAAMHGQGWQMAFAGLEMRTEGKVQYRALNAGRKMLDLRNIIDLNVLVIERAVVEQTGRFDENLRRTVDYDLILRLLNLTDVHYMPFIGAVYAHDGNDPNRITNREPASWLEVVQNKNFVDWDRTDRVGGRVSVLIPTYEDWQLTRTCLEALIAEARDDIEIIVVDNASRRAVGALLESFSLTDPRVWLVREPVNRNFALGSNRAFGFSTGETVVFLNNDTEVQAGWLASLRRVLNRPGVLAAQPLLVFPDGSVQCAGVVFPSRAVFPVHFLSQHPVEDALRLGSSFNVSAVTGAALAIRAADVDALHGFDPIYRNGWEDVDFCLRLGQLRPGALAVVTDSVVVHHESKTPGRGRYNAENREIFRKRWSRRLPRGDEDLWQAAGFTVAHYRADQTPGPDRIPRPVLIRSADRVGEGPAKGLPAFRWAIKIASPAGKRGLSWGDTHFASALGAAFERLGQTVVVDARGAHDRDSAYLDDVVLALRGVTRVDPQPGRVNLLWVISHPDLVDVEEIRPYDGAFAAGAQWAGRMSEQLDQPVETLLQCTDPERFRPGVAEPDTGEPVLFVGNSRNVFRPIVRDAIAAGVDVAVYGNMWERFVDRRYIHGTYFPNEKLAAAYRSAGILLNDHWEDMRREGFISNRVFDATAAGARVVSDYVPGLEEMFGGLVHTYRTLDELKDLLTRPRDETFPSEAERLWLAEPVHREHSFDARARTLLDTAVRLWKQ
jgi:glycosyltransferase involved in cell wall biosynthesis